MTAVFACTGGQAMGKTPYGTGSVYQRKDGRWVTQIFVDGKPKTRYAKNKREAEANIKAMWQDTALAEGQAKHGEISRSTSEPPASVKTVRDFAEEWLASAGLKATTVESYRNNLKAHVLPVLGDRLIDDVKSSDVASLVATIHKSGASQRTAQYAYSLTRRLLQV